MGFGRKIGPICYRRSGRARVQSQNRAFLLPKGRLVRGFGRKNSPFCNRRSRRTGVQSQKQPFLLPKGRLVRGFSRKNSLFCYRRSRRTGVQSQKQPYLLPKVTSDWGSVAKSGLFATEGQVGQGFSRKIGPFCYRRSGRARVRSQKQPFLLPKVRLGKGSVA